jgi:hypothetical protein
MKRTAKQVGTEAETAVVRFFQVNGHPEATRLALAGAADKGDVGNVPGLTIQVKSQRALALASWVDDSLKQSKVAGNLYAVVAHRRKGKGNPAEWYATLPLGQFVALWNKASQ